MSYIQLDSKGAVSSTAQRYQKSTFQRQYVDQRLGINTATDMTPKPSKAKASIFRQAWVLAQRYFQIMMRDRLNLGISIATAPIGILLINLAIAADEPFVLGNEADPQLAPLAQTVLLVFTSAAIWVGLASSLQEIVKEDDIYTRERLVNLNIVAYLTSKTFILSGLAFLQAIVMVMVIMISFQPPDTSIISWIVGLVITSYLTLFASICLGLMVSSLTKNSTQANTALPILLLPQIIFSGVLFKVKGLSQYFSWLMISRWSVGAYGSIVDINHLIPEATILLDGTSLDLPLNPSDVYDPSWSNLMLNWEILIVQGMIYLSIIYFVKKQQDIL